MTDMITRRDPFALPLYEVMNAMLNDMPTRGGARSGVTLPLDVYENDQEYVVQLAAPGLLPEQFEITVERNTLAVRGKIEVAQQEGARWLVRERVGGEFARSVQFPADVDVENVAAHLENGILVINLPKAATARARRITVNTPVSQN